MRKPNFNQPKQVNVFKMSCEELDKVNNEMMGELKKIPLNKPPNVNRRMSKSPKASSKSSTNMSPIPRPPQSKIDESMVIKDSAITTKKSFKDHLMNQFDTTMTNNNSNSNNTNGNTTPTHSNQRDKTFEYKIVRKDKMLIPMSSPDQVKNMRICEKMLLPNEKNYFVSEKNFKLIAEAINQKEINIQSLKILLDLAKADLKNSNTKFTSLIEDNETLHKKNEELILENNRLRTEIADIMLQFNKLMSVNQRTMLLLQFINENYGSKSQSQQQGIDPSIAKKINEKMKELDLIDILKPIPDSKPMTHVNGGSTLDQNEILCKKYLKKLIDAEKQIADLTKITEDKFDSLSDVSKEMVQAKIRIKELNDTNEKLEQENAFLKINCQNGYMENPIKYNTNTYNTNAHNNTPNNRMTYGNANNNNANSNANGNAMINDVKVLNNKIEEQLKTISDLKYDNTALQKELDQIKTTMNQYQNDSMQKEQETSQILNNQVNELRELIKEKDNDLSQFNNKLNNLNENAKDKDNIISELKNRINEYERIERTEKSERRRNTPNDSYYMKSPQSSKRNNLLNESSRNDDEFTEYLNKSTDDCLKELNNQMAKKNSRNYEVHNTSYSNMNNEKGTNEKGNGVKSGLPNNTGTIYNNNNKKAKMKEEKKDLEIKKLKDKVDALQNEEKNIYFEGENEDIGVNGVIYIGDLFLHLYNQAKLIEKIIE